MAPIGFSAMHGVNSPLFPLNLLLSGVTKTSTDYLTKLLLQNNTLIADEFFFHLMWFSVEKQKQKKTGWWSVEKTKIQNWVELYFYSYNPPCNF